MAGEEKKDPAQENSKTDRIFCNGNPLVARHFADLASKCQANYENSAFLSEF
jgi:hypothetical protein